MPIFIVVIIGAIILYLYYNRKSEKAKKEQEDKMINEKQHSYEEYSKKYDKVLNNI